MAELTPTRAGKTPKGGAEFPKISSDTPGRIVLGHEAPRFQSAMEGNDLGTVFSTFFGSLVKIGDRMLDAENALQAVEIQKENERQKTQGAADALTGKEAALPNDMDYFDAWTSSKATLQAEGLADRFAQDAAKLPWDADIGAFKEQWLKENLKNGEGAGTGNPVYDVHLLGRLNQRMGAVVDNHRERTLRGSVYQAGVDAVRALQAVLADPNSSEEQVAEATERLRRSQLDPEAGDKAVSGAVADTARTNPDALRKFSSNVLKGLPPSVAASVEQARVTAYDTAMTADEEKTVSAFKERIAQALQNDDLNEVTKILQEAKNIEGVSERKWLTSHIMKGVNSAVEKLADKNAAYDMISGGNRVPYDSSEVKKYLWGYMQEKGIDPLSPQGVAVYKANGFFVPEEVRVLVGRALQSKDPAAIGQMFQVLSGVQASSGLLAPEFIGKFIPEEMRPTVVSLLQNGQFGNVDPQAFMERLQEMRRTGTSQQDLRGITLTRHWKTPGDYTKDVNTAIQKHFSEKGFEDVKITNQMLEVFEDGAKRFSAQDAAASSDAVIAAGLAALSASNLYAVPAPGGGVRVESSKDSLDKVSLGDTEYPAHHFGSSATNSRTKQVENMSDNWSILSNDVYRSFEGLEGFEDGEFGAVLNKPGVPNLGPVGTYTMTDINNHAVILPIGGKFKGEDVPRTAKEAAEFWESKLGIHKTTKQHLLTWDPRLTYDPRDSVVLVPNRDMTGFTVNVRLHPMFKPKSVADLESLRKQEDEKIKSRQRSEDFTLPVSP